MKECFDLIRVVKSATFAMFRHSLILLAKHVAKKIVQTLPQLRQRREVQAPLSDFRKNSWYREIQKQVKDVMAPLRCHGNSDVDQR